MGRRDAFRKIAARGRRGLTAAAAALAGFALLSIAALPRPLFREPASTVLLGRDGRLLSAKIAADQQWRFPPLDRVPAKFKTAAIQFEDRRFERHWGVDPFAVARALREAVRRRRVTSGASTLSMQVIRLARGNPPRTLLEKIWETFLALGLELTHSKERILALYAAHAPMGGNIVGLEAASWRYFGRAPESLSWAEAGVLAVLPNSPALIHPGRNRDRLRAKRDRLLNRLHVAGYISASDLPLALAEPLPDAPLPLPAHATRLLDTLIKDRGLAGHRIHSTLDSSVQLAVEDLVARRAENLRARDIQNVAAIVIDHRDFSVRAYVGNGGIDDGREGRSVDIVQSPRSTGSTLKPFLFAAALQAGDIGPTTLLPDLPTQFPGFHPENNDNRYRGAVPAREALAQSLNVPAVRLLKLYGASKFYAFLKKMGFTTLFRPADQYGLSLILGGAEATLWDLSAAYANLASLAGGRGRTFQSTYRSLRILESDRADTDRKMDFGPGAAWLTEAALTEVVRPEDESHWQAFASARRIAWKTGTSQGYKDAWALGSDGSHTVGVWAGNADGEPRAGLTGTLAAAPLLFDLFNRLGAGGWFARPDFDLEETAVCRDDGFLPAAECATEKQWIPADSPFDRQSPHHRLLHLDATGRWRVHDGCEAVSKMTARSWFVLPPGQEFFYRTRHPEYRLPPPYRSDCRDEAPEAEDSSPIDLLYPDEGARVYVPTDLGGQRGRALFEAVHRRAAEVLYWHLDGRFLGTTRQFHQQALDLTAGVHELTLVDREGHRLRRRFEVLSAGRPATR